MTALLVAATSAGAAIAKGGVLAPLTLAGVAALCAVPLSRHLGPRFLTTWLISSGLVFPFLRSGSIDSDRVWVTIALVSLVATQLPGRTPPKLRSVSLVGGWFIVAYGWASVVTPGLSFITRLGSLESVLLPTATFVLAYRFVVDASDRVKTCQRITSAMAVGGVLLGVTGVAERIVGFELSSRSGGSARIDSELGGIARIAGPYAVPEVYGLVLTICLGATLYWALSHPSNRFRGIVAATPQLIALGLILFRIFWLDGILVVLIVVAFRPRRLGRALATLTLAGLIGIIAVPQIGSSGLVASRLDNTNNIQGRVDVWRIAVDLARSRPIRGVGLQHFVKAEAMLPQAANPRVQGTLSPHSSYLNVLAEQGLIGFIPLLGLTVAIAALVVATWKRAHTVEEGLFAAMLTAVSLAYVLTSLTLTMIPYGQSNAYMAAVLGVAVGRFGRDLTDMHPVDGRPLMLGQSIEQSPPSQARGERRLARHGYSEA